MKLRKKTHGFHRSVGKTTICERLRQINDLCQGDTETEIKIRKLLADIMLYAKKMNATLTEYKRDYDKDWWVRLPKEEKERLNKIRSDVGYKCLE